MATLGGAKALGLDDKIGTLEPGKQADIAVVSLANIAQQPVTDINAALVFSTNGRDVCAAFVAGTEVYREGRVTTTNEIEIKESLERLKDRLG